MATSLVTSEISRRHRVASSACRVAPPDPVIRPAILYDDMLHLVGL